MHAIFLGASTNCGLFAVLNLLNSPSASKNQLTLLLRSPTKFTENEQVVKIFSSKPELKETVKIVQGDALKEEDIEKLFKEAGGEQVELVVSSLGGKPEMSLCHPLQPTISPPQVTERALKNLLPQFQILTEKRKSLGLISPRLISVSSMGLGEKGHQDLPFMLKWFYGSFLKIPHDDKLEMEKLVINASGKGNEEIALEKNDEGWLDDFILVRPSLLTDGKETASYRAAERVPSAYSISRSDIGHFIATKCLPGNDEFKNRAVVVSN